MAFSVPTPCPKSWAAMTPTADGRFCGNCQHEVVDFSRMTEAEVYAWLAQPAVGSVCGFFRVGQFAPVVAPRPPRWRQWILAALAVLGLKPMELVEQAAAAPLPLPSGTTEQADSHVVPKGTVTILGRVLDDSTGLGIAGAEIFIGDTKYGAVTDAQGKFSFIMPQHWKPVQQGKVMLRVQGAPFEFESQTLAVAVSPSPQTLTITLKSLKDRGRIMGKIKMHEPPRKPPLK
jgi:CarboxypepD_reg-like domain